MPEREYLRVKEAAAILQVCPNTLRGWGVRGKIPEYRHPVSGYRLYRLSDIEEVIAKLERSVGIPLKPR